MSQIGNRQLPIVAPPLSQPDLSKSHELAQIQSVLADALGLGGQIVQAKTSDIRRSMQDRALADRVGATQDELEMARQRLAIEDIATQAFEANLASDQTVRNIRDASATERGAVDSFMARMNPEQRAVFATKFPFADPDNEQDVQNAIADSLADSDYNIWHKRINDSIGETGQADMMGLAKTLMSERFGKLPPSMQLRWESKLSPRVLNHINDYQTRQATRQQAELEQSTATSAAITAAEFVKGERPFEDMAAQADQMMNVRRTANQRTQSAYFDNYARLIGKAAVEAGGQTDSEDELNAIVGRLRGLNPSVIKRLENDVEGDVFKRVADASFGRQKKEAQDIFDSRPSSVPDLQRLVESVDSRRFSPAIANELKGKLKRDIDSGSAASIEASAVMDQIRKGQPVTRTPSPQAGDKIFFSMGGDPGEFMRTVGSVANVTTNRMKQLTDPTTMNPQRDLPEALEILDDIAKVDPERAMRWVDGVPNSGYVRMAHSALDGMDKDSEGYQEKLALLSTPEALASFNTASKMLKDTTLVQKMAEANPDVAAQVALIQSPGAPEAMSRQFIDKYSEAVMGAQLRGVLGKADDNSVHDYAVQQALDSIWSNWSNAEGQWINNGMFGPPSEDLDDAIDDLRSDGEPSLSKAIQQGQVVIVPAFGPDGKPTRFLEWNPATQDSEIIKPRNSRFKSLVARFAQDSPAAGPSQEDLEFTAQTHGITVEEVKRRLGVR